MNLQKKEFGSDCKLLYTDTDSLQYEIKHPDVYQVIKSHPDRFDTSDYPPDNIYGIKLVNKKVLGLMKDECNGKIILYLWGLRAKAYCFKVQGENDVKKAKGVKTNVVKNTLAPNDYNNCLVNSNLIYREQCTIRSHNHKLFTIKCSKLALIPFDEKRCLIENSTDTLPWGHKNAVYIEKSD